MLQLDIAVDNNTVEEGTEKSNLFQCDNSPVVDGVYQRRWESRSSVRTSPRKTIDFTRSGFFFPPDKQLVLLLPEIAVLGESVKREILLHSFYKYLNDIIHLEIHLISTVCHNIIYGGLAVTYPESIKIAAYTVMIDEYYHVYVARDMMNQLDSHFTGFKKLLFPASDSYNAVQEVQERLLPEHRDMFSIIAVCLFETTLIGDLIEFFNDKAVHPSIRFYINDHMNDESKHRGFFLELLAYTWKNLPDDYKVAIGKELVFFIKRYLNVESEKQYNQLILEKFLKDSHKIEELLSKLYENFTIVADIPIVKNILTVLKRTKIMDCGFVKDRFAEHNLYI